MTVDTTELRDAAKFLIEEPNGPTSSLLRSAADEIDELRSTLEATNAAIRGCRAAHAETKRELAAAVERLDSAEAALRFQSTVAARDHFARFGGGNG